MIYKNYDKCAGSKENTKTDYFSEGIEIIKETTMSISRAVQWLLKTFSPCSKPEIELNYNDLDGMCSRISALILIAEHQINKYDLNESLNLKPIENKSKWLDGYLDKLENLNNYIYEYFKILSKNRLPSPWELVDLEKIFWSCRQCKLKFGCLYTFKDVFSIFKPDLILNNLGSKFHQLYRANINELCNVLDKLFIEKDDKGYSGWPNAIEKKIVDSYVTASILSSLFYWQTEEKFLTLKIYKSSNLFSNCIKTIINQQISEDKIVTRELIGDKINIKGSWDEGYWGAYSVNRTSKSNKIP